MLLGGIGGRRRRGRQRMRWLDGITDSRESQWIPGVGDGQWGLECCDSWGRRELDTTEWLNWTELNLKKKTSPWSDVWGFNVIRKVSTSLPLSFTYTHTNTHTHTHMHTKVILLSTWTKKKRWQGFGEGIVIFSTVFFPISCFFLCSKLSSAEH